MSLFNKHIHISILLLVIACSSCMRKYVDWEQKKINEGYEKSEVVIKGMVERYIDNKFLLYEFKVGDSLVKQEMWLGQNVNTQIVKYYHGARFEILFDSKDFNRNMILFNKPIIKSHQTLNITEAEIINIGRPRTVALWFGFLNVICKYSVNGRGYIHDGSISKDLFFPDKDYDEITRRDLRKLKRKYKGKTCTIEYDVRNPGVSRLVEESVVK